MPYGRLHRDDDDDDDDDDAIITCARKLAVESIWPKFAQPKTQRTTQNKK